MSDFAKSENLKIAVVHDHMGWMGGGERTALTIALELGADFITAYSDNKTYPEYQRLLGDKLKKLTTKNNIFDKEVVRFFWMRYVFWRSRKLLSTYDVLIASGQTATEAVAKYSNRKASRILYNHTPPRRIYDLFAISRANYKWFLRPLFTVFAKLWEYRYISAIKKMDYNIANSENIQKRFNGFTGHEVNEVLWPPIETEKFSWISQGDYYLSWARVDENKRVELIIEAFQKRPDLKLVVASGGPHLENVRRMSAGYDNIQVVGWQSDDDLKELVGNCIAAIYIPRDEDAGMTHLEANAAGKPVLGVDEGGLIESLINNETGIKISAHPEVSDVLAGIDKMTTDWCLERKVRCIEHAARYSREAFGNRIREIVRENNPRLPIFGIDISRWSDRRNGQEIHTGVEVYVRGITRGLIGKLSAFRVRLYTPVLIKELDRRIQKIVPGQRRWTICKLAEELHGNPPDIFYTPGYLIPKTAPRNSFVTIHDVLFRREPHRYSLKEMVWQEIVTRWNIGRAKTIFTVSNNSLEDIEKYYGVSRRNIAIVPVAHAPWTDIDRNLPRKKEIVYVGRVEKKKSVDVLIRAFAMLQGKFPDYKLIIAGKPGFGSEEIRELASSNGGVEFRGYIDDREKKNLLSKASLFVHPSSNEGSSFPVLEALDAHTPAIVADCQVMREVGHDAVEYFRAEDATDLARAMEEVLNDAGKRCQLADRGSERLKDFSWDKSAEIILDNILE